jgi:hypothetical protein
MEKLLAAMFVALLMVGCGGDGKSESDGFESNQTAPETPPETNQSSAEISPIKSSEIAKIDLDDNETLDKIIADAIEFDKLQEREERKRAEEIERQYGKIIAEAIDWGKLQERGEEGEELYYAPNQQTPYTGSAKYMHDNGQVDGLLQFKDGKKDGLWTGWHPNGQKAFEENYKDGKRDGLWTGWYFNGQKRREINWKDEKMISEKEWDEDGNPK